MSTKFTPGPWVNEGKPADDDFGEHFVAVHDGDGERTFTIAAVIPSGNPDLNPKRTTANAALIADAPAMYALLEKIVAKQTCWIGNQLLDEAEALIAKHQREPQC